MGSITGAVTKSVSNVSTGKKWNDGIVGAAIGGTACGVLIAGSSSLVTTAFASAGAEALSNQVASYTPIISNWNGNDTTKKVTLNNVTDSIVSVVNDTVINGVTAIVTAKIAGNIVPMNNGWIKPQKFVSCFTGKYAIKSTMQNVAQSELLLIIELFKYLTDVCVKEGQCPNVILFVDIRM